MTVHGEFNWNELQTYQAEKAIAFYRETVGWEFRAEHMPTGDTYWIAAASGKPVCGILSLEAGTGRDEADRWVSYIHVDDLDIQAKRVLELGGKVLRQPWNVPGVGRIVMVRDPGGAEVGWVTPST
ncbi:Putative glyoxylase CFP32 [Halioglobus japonicus]|nr:Putative glyoxylase CFP32 [Halioglobus japonicus]